MPNSSKAASLAVRTATGAGWVIVWRMSTRIMGVISTIILVRLLGPADFGLVALATTFSQAVDWFATIGVNETLIREKTLNRRLYDTGFTLNLMRGVVMAVAIGAEAWPVALFFHDERLAYILMALALTTGLAALENIGVVDFRRELAFHKDFRLSVIPRIASIIVTVAWAFAFANFWALIAGIATNRVLRVGLSYWMHPYRPRLSLAAWRRMLGFSAWTWLCASTQLIRDRIDTIVIGRLYGPASVGVYSVGWEIGSLTSTELVEPLTSALFAGFSEARRSGGGIAAGYVRAVSATFLLTLPLGIGLSALASPVVRLAFGVKWLDAIPLVQIFALVCMFKVIAYFSGVLFNAHGFMALQFRVLFASLVVRCVMLAALIGPYGLIGAVMGFAGCTAIEELLSLILVLRRFNIRGRELLLGTWRCILAASVMGITLYSLGAGATPPDSGAWALAREILSSTAIGATTYIGTLLLAWFLSGRPSGAETAFLDIFGGTIRHLFRRGRPTARNGAQP